MHRKAAVLAAVLCAAPLAADVALHPLFSSNMVLQRNAAVPVWGTAAPGERISISIAGQTASAAADGAGAWRVSLKPMAAGGPHTMTVAGANTLTLANVLVGEVWICSGQSNMAWTTGQALNAEAELAAAEYPSIRLFSVPTRPSESPQASLAGSWAVCSPATVRGFSAVAYFFGRDLHKALNVPVGLVRTCVGGTPAEAWTPLPALEAEPAMKPLLDRWQATLAAYPEAKKKHDERMEAWKTEAEKAKAEGKAAPRPPAAPPGPLSPHRPANLYNGMVAPLVPFAVAGAIWYQGESNLGQGLKYFEKMKALIEGWRGIWGYEFPFYFVQLAPFGSYVATPMGPLWEAQAASLKIPGTGMAVTTDLVDNIKDIHPKNKLDVGNRLALWALAKTYGKAGIVYSGPLYKSMAVEGNKVRLSFAHVGSGLKSRDGKPLSDFEIAGADGKFVPAEAAVDGASIVVQSKEVAEPKQVRFGWSNTANPNLINAEGLPASPFQTKDWQGGTGE